MLVDEVGYIVDIAIDDDVEALLGRVVGGNVGGGEWMRCQQEQERLSFPRCTRIGIRSNKSGINSKVTNGKRQMIKWRKMQNDKYEVDDKKKKK